MSQHNPFSDNYTRHEPPKSNGAGAVLIVLAIVVGVFLLICGGMFAGGVWLAQQVQQDFERMAEEMEQFDGSAFETDADLRRYYALHNSGNYQEALTELDKALAEFPDDPVLHNAKSWTLATCPIDEVRDGELAVEHGTTACELSDWSRPEYVDTLAAAHAEAGDFEAAVECQQEALDLNPQGWYRAEFEHRLDLYKNKQPYREGAAAADEDFTIPAPATGADDASVDEPGSIESTSGASL